MDEAEPEQFPGRLAVCVSVKLVGAVHQVGVERQRSRCEAPRDHVCQRRRQA